MRAAPEAQAATEVPVAFWYKSLVLASFKCWCSVVDVDVKVNDESLVAGTPGSIPFRSRSQKAGDQGDSAAIIRQSISRSISQS